MRVWLLILLVLLGVGVYWWWSRGAATGKGARTDVGEGERLFREGMNYRQGLGVDVDYARARQLLQQGAELDHAGCQYELGLMVAEGLGGARDDGAAMQWIQRAAQSGEVRALLHMGRCCLNSAESDKVQAETWLQQAAEAGDAEAQYLLGMLYRDRNSPLWNSLKAANWITWAAEQGHAGAEYTLSDMYLHGGGVAKNIPQSDDWLQKAAQHGVPEAMFRLGKLYLSGAFGHTIKQDYRLALDWLRRAGAAGVGEAEYEVGMCYERNTGVDAPDMQRAAEYLLSAARLGFAPAQYRMGQLFRFGHHVPLDLEKSQHWFAAAAAQGYEDAADQEKAVRARLIQQTPVLPEPEKAPANTEKGVDWEG